MYASEYGWSRDQIMNDVYLDEYFVQQDLIQKRKRQKLKEQANLHLLPNMENKEIKQFFKDLDKEDKPQHQYSKDTKTDVDTLKQLKQQQN